MTDELNGLVLRKFCAIGNIISPQNDQPIPASIRLEQLITGRITFEADVEDNSWSVFANRLSSHSPFDFQGILDDGSRMLVKGLQVENQTIRNFTDIRLRGFVYHPGFVEVIDDPSSSGPYREIVCEITNLPLLRKGPIQFLYQDAEITLTEVDQYQLIRSVMATLKCTGVLCEMRMVFENPRDEHESDISISLFTSLLSLSQRTYVFCVSQFIKDSSGKVVKSKYQEPVFHYFRPTRPLIPVEHLRTFLEEAAGDYQNQYQIWNLGLAQDYFLQAMVLLSMWPQALGFFTALETLKQAFLELAGTQMSLERYVSEGRFKRHRIADQVLDLLCREFSELAQLRETSQDDEVIKKEKKNEIDTIRSKVGELNRRAYKLLLKKMFDHLHLQVADTELKRLVDFRNAIIHRGMPAMGNDNTAAEDSLRFATLVERVFMAILGYSGPLEHYDNGVQLA